MCDWCLSDAHLLITSEKKVKSVQCRRWCDENDNPDLRHKGWSPRFQRKPHLLWCKVFVPLEVPQDCEGGKNYDGNEVVPGLRSLYDIIKGYPQECVCTKCHEVEVKNWLFHFLRLQFIRARYRHWPSDTIAMHYVPHWYNSDISGMIWYWYFSFIANFILSKLIKSKRINMVYTFRSTLTLIRAGLIKC